MKETFPSQQESNPEKVHFEITVVSRENIHELERVRREVDGEENIVPEKFLGELHTYESGGEHAAFLIRDGEKVIGYIEADLRDDYIPKGADKEACSELKNYAHIARVGLLSEYRGARIGNKLLEHAEEWARANNMPAAWLDYLCENEKLETFYESAGYKTFMDFKDGNRDRLRRIAVKELQVRS